MFVIIGWVLALAAVFGVFIAHGGNIGVVLKALPFEMAAIGGAAVQGRARRPKKCWPRRWPRTAGAPGKAMICNGKRRSCGSIGGPQV
mgnify:CR=1 FL=1